MAKQDGATEKATPKKKRESRKKGQVLKSKETGNLFSFLALFSGVVFLGELMVKHIVKMVTRALDLLQQGATPFHIVAEMGKTALTIVCLAAFLVFVFSMVNYGLQVGFLFSPEIIKPDVKKVNPVTYWKNVMNIRKSGMELVQNFVALVVIGAVVYNVYLNNNQMFVQSIFLPWLDTMHLFEGVFRELLLKLGMAFLVLAMVDFFYRKYEYEEDLKMKKQDVKDEHKNSQGDPKIKQQQRKAMVDILKREASSKVPDGTVLIVNPTHYAVCLRFKEDKGDEVPRVIAKGIDGVARHMRKVAESEGIPVVRNVALARDLYARGTAGGYIPPDLYQLVTDILVELLVKQKVDISEMMRQ